MVRVVGVDHISIRVGDYKKSKAFYGKLMPFLGFKVLDEYADAIGWTNGKTRFWIGQADAKARTRKYRIGGRGEIREGFGADFLLFDPRKVGLSPLERVADLPGGGKRMIRRPVGVQGVWVNGTRVHDGRAYAPLARGPGRVLRR